MTELQTLKDMEAIIPVEKTYADGRLIPVTQNDIFVNFTLPSVVLDIIKNIYHSHVHHNKLADCEIRPVKANSYDEAILEIVNQYRKKINMYHNTISNLKNRFSFKDIIEDMKSPKNNDCMTRFNAFSILSTSYTHPPQVPPLTA